MMKLTVTLLAALVAADAAEARSHGQARRQYDENYVYSAAPYRPAASSIETPPAVSYATPATPAAVSSVYSFPAIPYASESSKAPVENLSTMGYPSVSSATPAPSSKPSYEYPTGPSSKPVEASSVKPSSPAGYSSKPVEASSVKPSSKPYGTGVLPSSGAPYPYGTGVPYKSSTPVSDLVTKTIYSAGKPVGTTVCKESEYPSTPVKVTTTTPVSAITKTLTTTLIYTVGTGSTARAMTTAVITISTETIYSTIVVTVTKPGPKPTGASYQTGSGEEGTTTIKSTTTSTKYVTIHASKPGSGSQATVGVVSGASYPTGPAGPGASQCPAPVTVTVTAKETITVTKGSGAEKPYSTLQGGYPVQPSKPVSGAETTKKYSAKKPSPTASGVYPVGNGTYLFRPTGFRTYGKPYGTGVPSKPTSLPAFSYVPKPYSAESLKSASPSQSTPAGYGAVPISSAAAAAASTPAGYPAAPAPSSAAGYGYGYN